MAIHVQKSEIGLDIKNCPFCGSTSISLENTWTASYWVKCLGCSATVHSDIIGDPESVESHKKSAKNAVLKWNRRDGVE